MGLSHVRAGAAFVLAFFTHIAHVDAKPDLRKSLLQSGMRLLRADVAASLAPFMVAHNTANSVRQVLASTNRAPVDDDVMGPAWPCSPFPERFVEELSMATMLSGSGWPQIEIKGSLNVGWPFKHPDL